MILDLAESPIPFDELLDRNAQANPDRGAIVMAESDYVLTLGEYAKRAGDAARYLAERGIGPGDRVAIWGQNSYAWAIWLAGAAWRGASAVALHPGLPREDLARSLAHARPSWLICDTVQRGRSLAELAQEAAESPALRASGLRGLTVMKGGDGDVSFEDILERGAAPAHLGKIGEPLNLQFTSGSTGRPKLVVLSHRSLVVNSAITAERSGVTEKDALASPLPLCHSGGLSSGLVMSIATGALWCTTYRFRAELVLGQIERHRCTVMQGTPTMFKATLDALASSPRKIDVSSMRLGFVGGAHCPPDITRRMIEEMGCERMAIIYGQTEFGPTVSMTDGKEPDELAYISSGYALHGVEIRIADPVTNTPLPEGEVGEVQTRGPTIMSGYFDDPVATAATLLPDGWLRTGDLGKMHGKYLQITARLKDIIIRGGENVSPFEVEEALRAMPGVREACVVGAPSAFWGEEICAVLSVAEGAGITVPALRAWCDEKLPRFQRPDKYVLRTELPMLESNKIDKRAVREAINAGAWPWAQ